MKKFIVIALLLTASTAMASSICEDRLAYNFGEVLDIGETCRYHNAGSGMMPCKITGECPCTGLFGDFLANCEADNAPEPEPEIVLGGVSTEEMLMTQLIDAMSLLVELLSQRLALMI